MKLIKWEDENGYLRQSLVKESDGDEAKDIGIPLDPPSLAEFSIPKEVQKDLHNELVSRGLICWNDVLIQQNSLTGTAEKIGRKHKLAKSDVRQLRRELINAYRR